MSYHWPVRETNKSLRSFLNGHAKGKQMTYLSAPLIEAASSKLVHPATLSNMVLFTGSIYCISCNVYQNLTNRNADLIEINKKFSNRCHDHGGENNKPLSKYNVIHTLLRLLQHYVIARDVSTKTSDYINFTKL